MGQSGGVEVRDTAGPDRGGPVFVIHTGGPQLKNEAPAETMFDSWIHQSLPARCAVAAHIRAAPAQSSGFGASRCGGFGKRNRRRVEPAAT